MIIQTNKNLKLSPKKINYQSYIDEDIDTKIKSEEEKNTKKIQNSPPKNIASSTLSPGAKTKNNMNPYISDKNTKKGDRILTLCHEINLSFIKKKIS